ncbi:MAG: inorganic phosphate transporter [Chlorobi bacterium]|nr:inorganic phosphate transporter [Chlorobiota bacterium]
MILLFLSSGLFLGWSLGANDAANVFGTAVGSKMVSFKKAAFIAGFFVIVGSVVQGAGATRTLGDLGAVNAIAGSFTVALSAAFTVYWMTKLKIPVSTSQAIVGAIIGWNFYSGFQTNYHSLSKIVSTWVFGPVLGAIFSIIIILVIKISIKHSKINLLKLDQLIRIALILTGAFGAYSLGANNIANVVGVFVNAVSFKPLDLGIITLSGMQQIFLAGSIAIAIGIVTYSKRVMETVGTNIMHLSSESAIAVVLAHSLVLFIFSSQSLSNLFVNIGLPPIPLVPVSSSQVIIGAIIGIGLLKGGRGIQYKVLGEISLGWLLTPILAGVFAFFALFFMNNVFNQEVYKKADYSNVKKYPVPETVNNVIKANEDSILKAGLKSATAKIVRFDSSLKVDKKRTNFKNAMNSQKSGENKLKQKIKNQYYIILSLSILLFISLIGIYYLRIKYKNSTNLKE